MKKYVIQAYYIIYPYGRILHVYYIIAEKQLRNRSRRWCNICFIVLSNIRLLPLTVYGNGRMSTSAYSPFIMSHPRLMRISLRIPCTYAYKLLLLLLLLLLLHHVSVWVCDYIECLYELPILPNTNIRTYRYSGGIKVTCRHYDSYILLYYVNYVTIKDRFYLTSLYWLF